MQVTPRMDYNNIFRLLLYHGAGADSDANHAVTENLNSLYLESPESRREDYRIVQVLTNDVADLDASAKDVIRNILLSLPS